MKITEQDFELADQFPYVVQHRTTIQFVTEPLSLGVISSRQSACIQLPSIPALLHQRILDRFSVRKIRPFQGVFFHDILSASLSGFRLLTLQLSTANAEQNILMRLCACFVLRLSVFRPLFTYMKFMPNAPIKRRGG